MPAREYSYNGYNGRKAQKQRVCVGGGCSSIKYACCGTGYRILVHALRYKYSIAVIECLLLMYAMNKTMPL